MAGHMRWKLQDERGSGAGMSVGMEDSPSEDGTSTISTCQIEGMEEIVAGPAGPLTLVFAAVPLEVTSKRVSVAVGFSP